MTKEELRELDNDNLTREQAIALVGLANVEAVENEYAEPVGRPSFPPSDQEGWLTWRASVEIDKSLLTPEQYEALFCDCGFDIILEAVYYTTPDDMKKVEELYEKYDMIDWGIIDFKVDHYRLC